MRNRWRLRTCLGLGLMSSFSYDEARAKVDRLRVGFDARGLVRYISVIPPGDKTLP